VKFSWKKVLLVILIILATVAVWNWSLLLYGVRQGIGQLNVVWNARPVSEILADSTAPDSLKQKLRLIEEVRHYAIDSLGLKDTENYKTLFDQQGKEIMWVVTASEPFKLKAKTWTFPVVGEVPYKGYFNVDLAKAEKEDLEKEGWDVNITNPSGWSTLGWFTDPILSDMLYKSEGDLASLIIHEMVHATIFVKDSVNFNENLASFIGDLAAIKFVLYKYGKDSKEHLIFIHEDSDFRLYVAHMLRGANLLDSLYNAIEPLPEPEKKTAKETVMRKIVTNMDTLHLYFNQQPSRRYEKKLPNNTIFLSYRRYTAQQMDLTKMFEEQFNSDFKKMVEYFKAHYPFL
jgi:predicted aminopeptidase